MITIILRVFFIYVLVLFLFRLMGKRQLGQMQPFELVLTLIIADLATIPMAEMSIPFFNGVVPLLTLVIFHFCITVLTKKSTRFSNFISGKPVIIIDSGGIVFSALKQLNITIDDLFESIRGAGYFNISEVQYAIMETNGKVSVMPKINNSPVTVEDMKIKKEQDSLPLTIISEGKLMKQNIGLSNKNEKFFLDIVKKEKIKNIKNILIMTITKNGEIYLQENNKKFKTFNLENI